MCLLKDDMGTDDVTNMQLLICAKYPHTPYIALPWFTSIKKQGCCARYWRRSCFHAWLDAWLIFQMVASDSSSRIKNENFPLAVKCLKPCPWVTHGTTHKCLMHGTICGNTSWQSSRPVAWLCMTKFDRELWETQSGWRLLDEKWRLALGRLWHAWCWHFAPDIIQGSCAKRARKRAKRAQKGAKRARKKKCTTWPSCFDRHDVSRVFENPFYAWSEEKAPPCGLELVGGMLFQSEPSQFFHRTV